MLQFHKHSKILQSHSSKWSIQGLLRPGAGGGTVGARHHPEPLGPALGQGECPSPHAGGDASPTLSDSIICEMLLSDLRQARDSSARELDLDIVP